jgi:hypothetical protein
MKKAEVKKSSKPKGTTKSIKTVKSKKVTADKSAVSDEEIGRKAYEIYLDRTSRGESGNASDDWNNAVNILKNL